ncbi:MAG: hypothetical protein ACR2NV_01720 [Thermoleophilaceae bacterium]
MTASVLIGLFAPTTAEAATLTYGRVKAAVQTRADALARQRTTVNAVLRQSPLRYYAQARWSFVDPTGCKGCEFDPETFELRDGPITRSCFAEFSARGSTRSRRVTVSIRSQTCN